LLPNVLRLEPSPAQIDVVAVIDGCDFTPEKADLFRKPRVENRRNPA
jgi:hypothetical protein